MRHTDEPEYMTVGMQYTVGLPLRRRVTQCANGLKCKALHYKIDTMHSGMHSLVDINAMCYHQLLPLAVTTVTIITATGSATANVQALLLLPMYMR
jgi:hypothetical protein